MESSRGRNGTDRDKHTVCSKGDSKDDHRTDGSIDESRRSADADALSALPRSHCVAQTLEHSAER